MGSSAARGGITTSTPPSIGTFQNYLSNPWQLQEDLDLMKLAVQNGKKWALISKKLTIPRSENSVKNRFNCLLRKERNQKLRYQIIDISKKEESSQSEDESKNSNFPSAEELSHSDIKHI